MSELGDFLERNESQRESRLFDLLRIPSVSADPAYKSEVDRAANWMANRFRSMGLATEVIATDGHPLVFAESPPVAGAPVALVYGHYDIQPPDPLEEWISPPFEPTLRDGKVHARGATDDKGQMLTHVESVAAWLEVEGKLPLQVKFLIEGEEEIGSPSLTRFLPDHRDKLACDCVVISDSGQFAPDVPAITYGLRGIAYFEVRLFGPMQDLHSGTFGGGVSNPANALVRMLAALVDDSGRVQVPGFYDDVTPLTERERQEFARLPFDEARFAERLGVEGFFGEKGFTTLERRWARPTCDINGLKSGYQGEGAKTVLPARASAKFSFRLVPRQDSTKISAGVRRLFESLLPPGVKMELIEHHGGPGVVFSLDSPFMAAASRSIEHGFGKPPVFIREGGSIPIVNDFAAQLAADVLLLGWGQDDDNTHSPNEKFSLVDFHRGVQTSAQLWKELATSRATV